MEEQRRLHDSDRPLGHDENPILNLQEEPTMIWKVYAYMVKALSGGKVYQNRWMCMHRIPPIPTWTVWWFFALKDRCGGRHQ
jgi:hypothetical protein